MEFWFIIAVFFLFTIVKSAFGFGGAIFSFLVLGFFVDIKSLILIGLLVTLYTDLIILARDHQGLSWRLLGLLVFLTIPTQILGVMAIDHYDSAWLLKAFAILTLIGALMPFVRITPGKLLGALLLAIAGLAQGAFGTGGPLAVAATKHQFSDKSQFRTTFSTYFIVVNTLRFIQLMLIQESYAWGEVWALWWLPLPIFVAVWIGRHLHMRMSNGVHQQGVSLMLLIAAVALLFK